MSQAIYSFSKARLLSVSPVTWEGKFDAPTDMLILEDNVPLTLPDEIELLLLST